MKRIKYVAIFVILLISGNFLRLFIEDKNIPDIEIRKEKSYRKNEAKKENDLSGTKKKYDINSISYEELLRLGFSKSRAEKLIGFREEVGIISEFSQLRNIPRFGESGVSQAKKYLFIDTEKIGNPSENYDGRDFIKYNINSLDEDKMRMLGFTKKEIKVLVSAIEENGIRSNIDLEKLIGKRRYEEMEKRIKFSD